VSDDRGVSDAYPVKTMILIVDDNPATCLTLKKLLDDPAYRLVFAQHGEEALSKAVRLRPDLVLLDTLMPGMDGCEVCRRLRRHPELSEVPIIMMTPPNDQRVRLRCIEAGADEFVTKPIDLAELRARVRMASRLNRYRRLLAERARFERLITLSPDGIVIVDAEGIIRLANVAFARMVGAGAREDVVGQKFLAFVHREGVETFARELIGLLADPHGVTRFEVEMVRGQGALVPVEINAGHFLWDGRPTVQIIARDITERRQAAERLRRAHVELRQAYDATIEGWSRALELRDRETEGHTQRVTELTVRLARAMGIEGEALVHIRRGALLHDIGKMGIPDHILRKPGPLTEEEQELMKKHTTYAYEMLSPIEYLRPALDIPYCHHEWWDGTGYPRGLKGEEIPLAARIFAVVDVWDALCSDRPYRRGLPPHEALAYIRRQAGTQLDPRVVEAFVELIAEELPLDPWERSRPPTG